MMRRTPMKRSGFKRAPRGIGRLAEKVQVELESAGQAEIGRPIIKPLHRGVIAPIAGFTPAPKPPEPVRSDRYRRLVAMFACKFCGVAGHSQAAHPNTGKGAGTKTASAFRFAPTARASAAATACSTRER